MERNEEMTEIEKIQYAKNFIDKLANGINPLDNTPIPEDDITNHVRISRCFFFVSDVLRQVIDGGFGKPPKKVSSKPKKAPFSATPEQLEDYEYSKYPISATAIARKINWLIQDIKDKKMENLSHRKITQWLIDIEMIEWREWENGKYKRFPTQTGEEFGLILNIWESYGRRNPVIYYNEEAQKFIIDNIEAIAATEVKKGDGHNHTIDSDEENSDSNEGDDEVLAGDIE